MKNLFFIMLLVSCACQVQKRKYQPGFYVHHKNSADRTTQHADNILTTGGQLTQKDETIKSSVVKDKKIQPKDSCDLLVFNDGTEIKAFIFDINDKEIRYRFCDEPAEKVHVTNRKNIVRIIYSNPAKNQPSSPEFAEPVKKTEPTPIINPPVSVADTTISRTKNDTVSKSNATTSCATIYFLDGAERKANILEIGLTEIKYKDCSMPDGPLFRELKSKLFMIVYANGTRELIEHKEEIVTEAPYEAPRRVRKKSAVTGFVFALMGFYPLVFVGGILAIIMGGSYYNKSQQDPEVYHQGGLAKTALVLGIISTALWLGIFLLGNLL